MQVQWFGQSAFRLTSEQATVFIDPFGDVSGLTARGLQFDYPPIDQVSADLVLVTHEHADHNAVDVIAGEPAVIRSTAGRKESPVGEVVAIASEHDRVAGTERGPNTIFVFTLDGLRVAHMGDFGQASLRDEQAEAIGTVDLWFVPVGSGPTIGAPEAAAIAQRLGARVVVPMHYRTPRVSFLEPADEFLGLIGEVRRLDGTRFETTDFAGEGPLAVVPAAP
jgi:L-ascorbate metabolism protein UlaG (beta-lactamase superfamily)